MSLKLDLRKGIVGNECCFKFRSYSPALGVPEKRLGRHNNERLSEGQTDLTTEKMEVVSWLAAVGHDLPDQIFKDYFLSNKEKFVSPY